MSDLPTKPKPPSVVIIVIVIVAVAVALWFQVSRTVARGDSVAGGWLVFGGAMLVVGGIVGAVMWRAVRRQRVQKQALVAQDPTSIVWASMRLESVAGFVKRALPKLGLEEKVARMHSSPTAAADAYGFRLLQGGAALKPLYTIPRDRIVGVVTAEMREGAYAYPTLGVAVSHPADIALIPVPVMRDDAPLRRVSPADLQRLAERVAALWAVPVVDAPQLSELSKSHTNEEGAS